MELLQYIQAWYDQVPTDSQAFISGQLVFGFPGLPDLTHKNAPNAIQVIFRKMQEGGYSYMVGYCCALTGCIDYALRDYSNPDTFRDIIKMEKEVEAKLMSLNSLDSADKHRNRINNAPQEFEEHKHTVETWNELKRNYLNHDYYKRYSDYWHDQYLRNMGRNLF